MIGGGEFDPPIVNMWASALKESATEMQIWFVFFSLTRMPMDSALRMVGRDTF